MMGGSRRRAPLSERGAAAVEFALVLFPMLYLIFGGISYGYMFSFRQAMSQSASEGSRAAVGAYTVGDKVCAAVGPYGVATCPAQYAASQAVKNALNTYGLACNTDHLTCTIDIGTNKPVVAPTPPATATATATIPQCAAERTCISVRVSYPYRAHSLLPTVPGMGIILPADLTFTSVVQVA